MTFCCLPVPHPASLAGGGSVLSFLLHCQAVRCAQVEEVVSSSMAEAVNGEVKLTTDEEFKGSFRTGTVHTSSVTLNNDYH